MKKRFLAVLALVVLLFQSCSTAPERVATPAAPQAGASREQELEREIRKMLDLTGAGNLGLQAMSGMVNSMKQSMPNVPDAFWEEFQKDVSVNELVELVVPIYKKHLTLEEVRAANAFYSTAEGQAIVRKLPMVMTEAMQVGREWGEKIAMRAISRLQEKGLVPASH
ncbi:MAG: DUF2059 domain-containing protein [Nibricoccus sp.]